MPQGLMDLLYVGNQDLYLKSNPSITFFKKVYRTHTNFAQESVRVDFQRSDANVYEKTQFKAKIMRHADLVAQIYFVMELPDIISDNVMSFRWIENIGEAIIDNYQISIGGNIIDKQTGEFLHAMNYMTISADKRALYNQMTGNVIENNNPEQFQIDSNNLSLIPIRYRIGGAYPTNTDPNAFLGDEDSFYPSIPKRKIYIPLKFWFNKDIGNALPIVSLQYAEVEISLELRAISDLYKLFYNLDGVQDFYAPAPYINAHQIKNFVSNARQRFMISDTVLDIRAYLEVNYIYLDNLERRYFAYKPLEYLIEQTTRIERISLEENNIIDFVLQNPIKEILWFCRRDDVKKRNAWFDFTEIKDKGRIMKSAKLMFNGIDRISEKDAEYFNWLQPYQHHTGTGKPGLFCYCFSLYPEEYQPSGSVNASRINKVQFYLKARKTQDPSYKYDVVFYVINYNILKVMSGMASVAYSL
jgi:hypothetical protein